MAYGAAEAGSGGVNDIENKAKYHQRR